jgi:hypothetical protein
MEVNLNGLPNNAIHVSGFSGDHGGIVKWNAVSRVDAVFSYGWLVWMFLINPHGATTQKTAIFNFFFFFPLISQRLEMCGSVAGDLDGDILGCDSPY